MLCRARRIPRLWSAPAAREGRTVSISRDDICTRFLESIPYELYAFQEEALLAWFTAEQGVLVSAPTGMGKTLIAQAALFEALHLNRRLYYTSPLIALTEQKFREFQDAAESWGFARDDVGLITGNRRVNPDARLLVVVAEILLNHLLASDDRLADVSAVVMDEFHNFNDLERGIVWELSLALLPRHVRLMLLSATVGNAYEFVRWQETQHQRTLRLVQTDERRVPLEFVWVGDKLLTEQLPAMWTPGDAENRVPALVFCFSRDECWELAEKLKGLSLISGDTRARIEAELNPDDFKEGVGPKLRQMLVRGVGVHHAGVLPRHKEIVEDLFLKKLVPFVVCTETLAAGINLPARSVVLSTLLKGPPKEKKLIPSSAAHQMFGRAGRPQFDTQGYVYAVAHEDDVRIEKWRAKYDQIDPNSKDPGLLRARKELERKKPSRRKTEQYWTEGQFQSLIKAGPGKLYSRSMIPYSVLIFLLTRSGGLADVRSFLTRRFNTPERNAASQEQLDHMVSNLQALGYLEREEGGDHVTLAESIYSLLQFRSVDPLYGAYLCEMLAYSNFDEKTLALESVLEIPRPLLWRVRIPDTIPVGPLQEQVLGPQMIAMGVLTAEGAVAKNEDDPDDYWEEPEEERPPTFPEMLKIAFESKLAAPEPFFVQAKWLAGRLLEPEAEFFKVVRSCDLTKQEGIVLRHLLRLVILAGEFFTRTQDPDYQRLAEGVTAHCQAVDRRYTDKFLAQAQESRKLLAEVPH